MVNSFGSMCWNFSSSLDVEAVFWSASRIPLFISNSLQKDLLKLEIYFWRIDDFIHNKETQNTPNQARRQQTQAGKNKPETNRPKLPDYATPKHNWSLKCSDQGSQTCPRLLFLGIFASVSWLPQGPSSYQLVQCSWSHRGGLWWGGAACDA